MRQPSTRPANGSSQWWKRGGLPLLCRLFALGLVLSSCDVFSGDEDNVSVVPYEGPLVTKADAQVTGPARTSDWRGRADGETVVLIRSEFCGAECSQAYRIELRDRGPSGRLPAFACAVFERTEFLYGNDNGDFEVTERRTLGDGLVAIDRWDPDGGVVSGKISGDLADDLFFWYDFGPGNAPAD